MIKNNQKYDLENRITELEKENAILNEKLKQVHSFDNTKKLQNSEQDIYFLFFNTLKDFFWILDEQGNIIFVNDYVVSRLEYTREELYKMNVLTVHPPERRDEALKIVGEMLEGGAEFCPIPVFSKNGKYIPVETRVVKGQWNNKSVIFGISKDITELRLSEEKFSKAFHINSNSTAISEFETGKYVNVNQKFLDTFQLTREEVIGKTSVELNIFNEKTRKKLLKKLSETDSFTDFEIELKFKGKQIIGLFSANVFYLQEKKCWITIMQNITERKQAEVLQKKNAIIEIQNDEFKRLNDELQIAKEKAEQSEQILRSYFDYAPDGIFIIDNNGIYVDVNQESCKLFGYTRDEMLDACKIPIVVKDDYLKAKKSVEILLSQGKCTEEFQFLRKDDSVFFGLMSSVKISSNQTLAFVKNIDALKKTELELIKAKEKAEESDRLKTAFLQNMSHEIRTPMNAINGFSQMLNRPNLSAEKRKNFTSIIINSSNQLQSVVENILTISSLETKQEKFNLQPVIINNIITNLLEIFKKLAFNQNVSLYSKLLLTDKQSEIYTDKTKITQILTNLITNALKFTHEGYIEFGYNLKMESKPVEIEFYVKDSGIGIKPEMLEKIFDRFTQAETGLTRRYGGSGLGLSISKGFLELLGGKIWVHSVPGLGSTFYFTIPYKPIVEFDKLNLPAKQNENVTTVLVAEDEEYNFLVIEELLIEMDLKLIHAKDGKETVDFCKTNPNINLILMDIKMPIMDGHTAARLIREFKPDVTIIAQSAYSLEQYREKYTQAIFNDYISKPIKQDELIQKLNKYINKQVNKYI
jgi:PAS domain S-box-containing protein